MPIEFDTISSSLEGDGLSNRTRLTSRRYEGAVLALESGGKRVAESVRTTHRAPQA
jgi:hypothetical protein